MTFRATLALLLIQMLSATSWAGEITAVSGDVHEHARTLPPELLASLSILPAASGPIHCGEVQNLSFHYVPGSESPPLRGFELTIAAGSELSFGAGDIVDSGVLGDFGDYHFEIVDNGDGSFSVAGVLLGPTSGLTVPADLFTLDVHGAASGSGQVQIASYILRDLANVDFFATVDDALVEVDCVPPGAVTGLACFPGHEQVILIWTDPADPDLELLEVWRGVWHDGGGASVYPEYDDIPGNTIPTRPADREAAAASSEWQLAGLADPGDGSFIDHHPPRGVYYYEVFAQDLAGNFGPPPAANDRSLNYWLGDVRDSGSGDGSYDGVVNVDDMAAFDLSFGLSDGDGGYDNEIDVGETDDMSRIGFPTTDNIIDFEDLMIFAMNHFPPVAPHIPSGTAYAHLSWFSVGPQAWTLVLLNPCLDLKGLRLTATLSGPGSAVVAPGTLLGTQDAPYYLNNIDAHGMDISVAILGTDLRLEGSGAIFQVVLPAGVQPSFLQVTARNKNNGPVNVVLEPTGAQEAPLSYSLAPTWPNPFNPSTQIRFELPEAQHVRLLVADSAGRAVTVLADELFPAGSHVKAWDGRDARGEPVASGVYYARIEAGPLRETAKMLLLK